MCSGKPKSYYVYRNWNNKCDWDAVSSKKKNAEFEVSLLFMKIEFKDYITYYFFYLLKSYRVNSFFIIIQLVIILFSSQSYRIFFTDSHV